VDGVGRVEELPFGKQARTARLEVGVGSEEDVGVFIVVFSLVFSLVFE
jgi:hypothetical protein